LRVGDLYGGCHGNGVAGHANGYAGFGFYGLLWHECGVYGFRQRQRRHVFVEW
jgi:hypothetical protein